MNEKSQKNIQMPQIQAPRVKPIDIVYISELERGHESVISNTVCYLA